MRRSEIDVHRAEQVYKKFTNPGPNALARGVLFPMIGALEGSKVDVRFMSDAENRIRNYPAETGPGRIFIANHPHESDAFRLAAAFRKAEGFKPILNRTITQAKSGLFRNHIRGPLIEAIGAVPVFRSKDLEHDAEADWRQTRSRTLLTNFCASYLLKHGNVMIFPQGTTEKDKKLLPGQKALDAVPFKPGISFLALHSELPPNINVVPMGINYTPDDHTHITFGMPFTPEVLGVGECNDRASREAFRAVAQQRVQACIDY